MGSRALRRPTATRSWWQVELRGRPEPLRQASLRPLQGLHADHTRGRVGEHRDGEPGRCRSKPWKELMRLFSPIPANTRSLRRASARRRSLPPNCSSSPSSSTRACRYRRIAGRRCNPFGRQHTPLAFAVPPAVPLIRGQSARACRHHGKRVEVLPDVPTMAETGIHIRKPTPCRACWCRRARPTEMSTLLIPEMVKATKFPDVKAKWADLGLEIICNSPDVPRIDQARDRQMGQGDPRRQDSAGSVNE